MENWFVFYFFNYLHLTRKLHALLSIRITHISILKLNVFLLFDWKQSNIFFYILELYNKNDENFGSNKNGEPFLISPTTQHQHFV